jgi:cytochrome c oxidase cbb3-type subunit IV
MIEHVLQRIGGIENYGILSIVLFFLFFLGMLAWAFRLKRPFLKSMAALPLEADADNDQPERPYE